LEFGDFGPENELAVREHPGHGVEELVLDRGVLRGQVDERNGVAAAHRARNAHTGIGRRMSLIKIMLRLARRLSDGIIASERCPRHRVAAHPREMSVRASGSTARAVRRNTTG